MKSNSCFKDKLKKGAGQLIALVLIMVAAWYISEYHYQLMMIQGDSMSPSYHNMQLVILDKQVETVNYGDVIAFRCDDLEAVLVKRVAACFGDTVQIKDGILLVNGEISEVYGQGVVFEYAGTVAEEIVLGEGEYFVIGDNVAESKDSRYAEVGMVGAESIIGRILEKE